MDIQIAGENAVIIYFGQTPSSDMSLKIQATVNLIHQYFDHTIIDLVASYTSLLVIYKIEHIDHLSLTEQLKSILKQVSGSQVAHNKTIELPVYYSLEAGIDLPHIASYCNLSVEEVIQIHQQQTYQVYAIGFAPGFAYLGEVDHRISVPRLSTPRLEVPKGAVAIADRQTAVYPNVSPGGWNILGLCPIEMFSKQKQPHMMVQVGDNIKFNRISKSEFIALGGKL